MNSNLLPCPFCGSTNLRHEFSGSQGYIECNECGTQGPCDERAADPICDQDAGCAAWNRRAACRPKPPSLKEQALESLHHLEAGCEPNIDLLRRALEALPGEVEELAQPRSQAEMLAVRPMMEQIAAMGDCIGQQTVGQIMAISQRAAAWLAENPPGQPVAIEPSGCPTPGACSCVMPSTSTAHALPLPREVEVEG